MWSSPVQIFHALTRWRKRTTAAVEWRFPQSAWVRRRRGRGSEALPHRRRWSSGGARVWGARARERIVERSKWSDEGERGIYRHGEKLFARRFRTNVPLPFLLHATCVTHVLCSVDRVRSWVNRIMHRGMRTDCAAKPKIWIRFVLKFRSQFLQLTRTQWRFWMSFK